jgi:hypothetical protein
VKLICFLKTIWRTLSGLTANDLISGVIPISGHEYEELERHNNVYVVVSKCEECGEIDIIWSKTELP